MTMQVISIPDFVDMIDHVAVRNNQPLMCWGKPGVGKSMGVRAALVRC
jgi:MoxR-like ATPase